VELKLKKPDQRTEIKKKTSIEITTKRVGTENRKKLKLRDSVSKGEQKS